MKYNFDEIINRKNTNSLKWDAKEFLKLYGITDHFNEETLPLFTADMDIACPEKIVDAMRRTVDNRIYGYSIVPNHYYDAIINWFQTRHDLEIKKEEITYCPGTVYALKMAVKALTKKGDGIIIQRPVYSPFTYTIEGNERVVKNNQLIRDENGKYHLNLEEFEKLCKEKTTTMFILCNPHNPTGRIFSPENLKKMAKICLENNVVIVADEIHGDLIRQDQTFTPILKVAESNENIIMCTAINKTFNVAGLHASNIVIPNKEIRNTFKKELGMSMASPFTINAVISAYTECTDWLEELKTYFDDTIDYVMNFLKEHMPKVTFSRPEGTYIFWMDFSGYGISKEEIKKRIYVDANVILESGPMFDPDLGDGFERICLSSPRPIVVEAFNRIKKAFADLED